MSRSSSLRLWWQDLLPRERALLSMMFFSLAVFLLWFLLWRPITRDLHQATTALESSRVDLEWMQAAQSAIGTGPRNVGVSRVNRGNQSMLAVVEASARAHSLGESFRRGEPSGDDRVRVWLEEVSFDAMISWVQSMQDSSGFDVAEADITRLDLPGMVDVRIVLSER